MKIIISNEAANWYINELNLKENDTIRFFVRYGGMGGNVPGFSLGVNVQKPVQPHTLITVEKIDFFIEESDVWYFENNDLHIQFDDKLHEPLFSYVATSN